MVGQFFASKGQLISKADYQAKDSSKKRTNEFVFTSMRRVFVHFFEESLARKKTFRDYLTFNQSMKSALTLNTQNFVEKGKFSCFLNQNSFNN